MSWAVQHRERAAGDGDAVAFGQPMVGGDVTCLAEPVGAPLLGEAVEQELVGPMWALDRYAPQLLLRFGGAAGVVDVAVGQDDLVDHKARLFDAGLDPLQIA